MALKTFLLLIAMTPLWLPQIVLGADNSNEPELGTCLENSQSPAVDFDRAWGCAHRLYSEAERSRRQREDGWEQICRDYGKAGMEFGQRAIELAPDRVEGHYYYGLNVGKYADGVSVFTAVREGLKGSTQEALEKAYAIDPLFDQGGPMKALGRFWHLLPWPLRDRDKAVAYLNEYRGHFPESPQGMVFLAEVLLDAGRGDEARTLLQQAARGELDPFYRNRAEELLAGVDR